MKIILSRKGFDSANGGIVSPIFENGTVLTFPIPSNDKDTYNDLQYQGVSYSSLLSDLKYKGGIHCHIDPDLDQDRRVKKIEEWVPAFGQTAASSAYLKNIGVQKGDVFLFFGNFHFVEKVGERYCYKKKTGDFYKDNDLQVIWGYLQVAEIVDKAEEQKKIWWHPHSSDIFIGQKENVIFKATKNLSFDEDLPGAGLLPFNKARVLTAENCKKATWKYNSVYDTDHIISKRKNMAKDPSSGIYYAGIWQELGLKESEDCSEWAKSVIITSE